ncbi:MAG TPA: NlpC/P60 family protein [Limnochordales bacterium]|nr:NlpC/P60 family protein [Limnochordales bacterium]
MAMRMRPRLRLACCALAAALAVMPGAAAAQADTQGADATPAALVRRPLTEEEGRQVALAALAYAEVTYTIGEETFQGVPYRWGGRVTVSQFLDQVAGGDGLDELGVDASGVAVEALRSIEPGLRFLVGPPDNPVFWADATSAVLYEFNVEPVAPDQLRAGDLIFFRSGDGGIGGVAVVTGRSGTRVDFVVASARQGRVVHTFARTDGDYWRSHIVGGGRFLLTQPAP